jgi:hypothetical protein
VTASSATPTSPSSTSTGTPSATTLDATSSLSVAQTSVPTTASTISPQATLSTPNVAEGIRSSASPISSSASLSSPGILTGSYPSKSDFLYAGSGVDGLTKYTTSGSVDWTKTGIYADDVIVDADGNVYTLRTDYGDIRSYDSSGNERWSIDTLDTNAGYSDVTETGALYVLQNDSSGGDTRLLKKLDISDGSVLWQETWVHQGWSSMGVDGDENVYVSNSSGEVRRYDADGTVAWTVSHYPSGVDLYVSGSDTLYVINGSDFVELSPSDGSKVQTNATSMATSQASLGEEETFYFTHAPDSGSKLVRYHFPSDTVEWATTLSTGFAINVDVNVQGDVYVTEDHSSHTIEKYNASDGSHVATVGSDLATDPTLAMYPDIATNETSWTIARDATVGATQLDIDVTTKTAIGGRIENISASATDLASTVTSLTPVGVRGVNVDATPTSATSNLNIVGTTKSTGAVAEAVEAVGTPPTSVTTGSATTEAQSLSRTATFSPTVGHVVGDAISTGLAPSTTLLTASGSRSGGASADPLTSTSMMSAPTVSASASTQATRYAGTTALKAPTGYIVGDAEASPYEATVTLLTALEFERRITSLSDSSNRSQIERTRNDSSIVEIDSNTRNSE